MTEKTVKAVRLVRLPEPEVRHPIKAATLLYSAPNYILRGPIYMIFVITFSALIYSFVGRVDDIVVCNLELVAPEDVIQAPIDGIVTEVNANEGTRVGFLAQLAQIQFKTGAGQESELDALTKAMEGVDKELRDLAEKKTETERLLKSQEQEIEELKKNRDLLIKKQIQDENEYNLQIQTAEAVIEKKKLQIETAKNAMEDIKRKIEVRKAELAQATKRHADDKALFDKGLIKVTELDASVAALRAAKENLEQAESDLKKAEIQIRQLEIELKEAEEQPNRLRNDWAQQKLKKNEETLSLESRIRNLFHQISQTRLEYEQQERRLKERQEELAKKKGETKIMEKFGVEIDGEIATLRAMQPGTIIASLVKPGQMISRGTPMFRIIKEAEPLYARIYVANKDIGKMETGQAVKIKYFAYPYQEYGIQEGVISKISTTPSRTPGYESMYEVSVALSKLTIKVGKREEPLTIGLRGLAQIKTGDKRLIEIVFTPLSKWLNAEGEYAAPKARGKETGESGTDSAPSL